VQVSRAVNGITLVTDSFERLARAVALRDGQDGQNLVGLLNLADRSTDPAKGMARGEVTPFDPSLLKPAPEKTLDQDRPRGVERSL